MINYEGLFIIDSDLSPDALKGAVQAVSDLITRNGGTVGQLQEWGRRKLAYTVKKKREGHYVLVLFTMPGEAVAKLRTQLFLNEQVLKYLITKKLPPRKFIVRERPPKPGAAATTPVAPRPESVTQY